MSQRQRDGLDRMAASEPAGAVLGLRNDLGPFRRIELQRRRRPLDEHEPDGDAAGQPRRQRNRDIREGVIGGRRGGRSRQLGASGR